MLFQVAANQFLVVKKTWPNLLILCSGAALNFVINLGLIPVIGIEGAALATLVGYIVSDVICVIVLCRMKLMVVSGRFLLATAVMAGFMAGWRFLFPDQGIIGTAVAVAMSVFFLFLYRSDLKTLWGMIRSKRSSGEDSDDPSGVDDAVIVDDTDADEPVDSD